MSQIQVQLVREEFMPEFYTWPDAALTARRLLEQGQYRVQAELTIPGVRGAYTEIAEEIFDLTNNPGREDERLELYGRHRSVSVGDIVSIDGVDMLCASIGWIRLPAQA